MRYIRQFSKIISKKNISPEYITFFVTNKCNMECQHCFYWKNIDSGEKDLSPDEIEAVSKHMDNFLFLLITGGEPFLRGDIDKVVHVFYNNNNIRKLSIMTNGYFTDRIIDNIERILADCPALQLTLNISIDGIEEDHDKFRGCQGAFQHLLETVHRIKKVQAVYPKLSIGAVCSYSDYNQHKVIKVYQYIRDVLKLDSFNCPLVRGDTRNNAIKPGDIGLYRDIMRLVQKDIVNRRLKGVNDPLLSNFIYVSKFIATDIIIKTAINNCRITSCYAGKINAVIYPGGDIYPCELLNNKIGNLRNANYDFKALWLSKERKDITDKIEEAKCHCSHGCNMLSNIVYNPKYLPEIVMNFMNMLLHNLKSGNRLV